MILASLFQSPLLRGLFVCLLLAGCEHQPAQPVRLSGQTMGTWYHLKYIAPKASPTTQQVQKLVDQRLGDINQNMSTYLADSELSRFNRSPSAKPFAVSSSTAEVVATALQIGVESGGALDVTVLPLVEIWGFGSKKRIENPPDEAAIQRARAKTGRLKLKAHINPPSLTKVLGNVSVDLSSIAKGYAVDQVAQTLDSLGIHHYLVEIGGELRASGEKAPSHPWVVGIEVPGNEPGQVQRSLPLENLSMATSGDYRNYFEKDGVRYSHTINPNTGRPIGHHLASVSVVAEDCMTADGWATALNVLGEVEGFQLAQKKKLKAYFVFRAGDQFQVKATQGFLALSTKTKQ